MSPDRTVGDDPDHRVTVSRYSDLAARERGLTHRQVDRIVAGFEAGATEALVIEEWCDDKGWPETEGGPQVYFGETLGRGDKAWRFASGGKIEWVPKSLTTVFENDLTDPLETPQRGLSEFGSGGRS